MTQTQSTAARRTSRWVSLQEPLAQLVLDPARREVLAVTGLAVGGILIALLTYRGLPATLLDIAGIDRGHPVLWQTTRALMWMPLAVAAGATWRRIADRPLIDRTLLWLAGLAGFFQVAVFIVAGLGLGFGYSPYDHRILPLVANLLSVLTMLVAIELSRACIIAVVGRRNPTLALASATVLFAGLSLPLSGWSQIAGPEAAIATAGEHVLPALSEGLLASFLAFVGGPAGAMAYRGVIEVFEWGSPILPSLPWPVIAFLGTLTPIVGLWLIQTPAQAAEPAGSPSRGDAHTRRQRLSWLGVAGISVTMIWFVTGLFGVQPMIVSGPSMLPSLEAGDMVVIAEVDTASIEVGDIIRFIQRGSPVIHRVVAIEDGGGQRVFVTRGDNNNVDDDPVLPGDVAGKVVLVIPNAGIPSTFLRNLVGGSS